MPVGGSAAAWPGAGRAETYLGTVSVGGIRVRPAAVSLRGMIDRSEAANLRLTFLVRGEREETR